MSTKTLWTLLLVSSLCLVAGLTLVEGRPGRAAGLAWADPRHADAAKVAFLAGELSDEDRLTLTSALAGLGHPGVVLLDSPRCQRPNEMFLEQFDPKRVVLVAPSPGIKTTLERRLRVKVSTERWGPCRPVGLWKALFPKPSALVVCPAEPRGLLLQAACLAGAMKAPLFITHGTPEDSERLQDCLRGWEIKQIYAAGKAYATCGSCASQRLIHLKDEHAVSQAYRRHCRERGACGTLVVANPEDTRAGRGSMSVLAPYLALREGAPLLLTNGDGTNVESIVAAAVEQPALKHADSVILLANLNAIPMQRRPNPLPEGKDRFIEMEPLTPTGNEPYSFAVGRLFHEDPGIVLLMLTRPRLWHGTGRPRALVVSNPGGGLPLLETFSRTTARELANAGYDTTSIFAQRAARDEIRRLLPQQTIFLWEGHYSTLVREYEIQEWTEPLQPSLIFLQSCLALTEDKAQPFLNRGACAVVGTSTRTYSGSGGAFTLAYMNALLYERQSLGGALRQAKNFMQTFTQLKEKRLGSQTKLGGANIRTAWAFTLWGDPTLELPAPPPPEQQLPPVQHHVQGKTIRIALPEAAHGKTTTGRYESESWPNARLGGLLKSTDSESSRLVPLVFAEVRLHAPGDKPPRLSSRLPGRNWVFSWDARRSCGYLLAAPRAGDKELRFQVQWN